MSSSPQGPVACPGCGAQASGRFCSSCGATLAGVTCASCSAPLSAGARFCHRCGTPVGAAAAPAQASPAPGPAAGSGALPWAVAAIALVALVALVAGQRFGRTRGGAAPAPAAASQPLGRSSTDIGSMTPEERAERLYNRVMTYAERGQQDSLAIFAPMALAAYQMIPSPTLDHRYDLGRIAAVAGEPEIATAQADTILRANGQHLLGLILAAHAAGMRNQPSQAREYLARLVAAAPTERAKRLPEYELHANDIDAALGEARQR